MKYITSVGGREYDIVLAEADGVTVDDERHEVDLQSIDGGFHYSLLVGAVSYEVFVERCDDLCFVTIGGQRFRVKVEDERARRLGDRQVTPDATGEATVTSPMPGMVVAVLVAEGQMVKTGQGLLILEAMKMENEIRAPRDGLVEKVSVASGERVSQDDVLLHIGPPAPQA